MPRCSIIQCGRASQTPSGTGLTFHRFPQDLELKRKWINAIGAHNINPRHKFRCVCSKHFKESEFNRTLNVMRLREDIVPSLYLETSSSPNSQSPDLTEKDNIQKSHVFGRTTSQPQNITQDAESSNSSTKSCFIKKENDQESHVFGETSPHSDNVTEDEDCTGTRTTDSPAYVLIVKENVQELHNYCSAGGAPSQLQNITQDAQYKLAEKRRHLEKIEKLTERSMKQRCKIRALNEKVRRSHKKIAGLIETIEQQKYLGEKVRRANKKIAALSEIIEQLVPDKTDRQLLVGDNCTEE